MINIDATLRMLTRLLAALALLIPLTGNAAHAEEATKEQKRLIGFMAKIKCIAERDKHGMEWEWKQIKKFIERDDKDNEELKRFSGRPAVMIAADQIRLALKETNCDGVNRQSVTWKNAVWMTERLNKDGTPQPGFFKKQARSIVE